MEFIKNIREFNDNHIVSLQQGYFDTDNILFSCGQMIQDIIRKALCYKEQGQNDIFILLYKIKEEYDTAIKYTMFDETDKGTKERVYECFCSVDKKLDQISCAFEEQRKASFTMNFIEACKKAIKDDEFIQGENFNKDVYALYCSALNGFYLYEYQKNIGMVSMTVNKHPVPWNVTATTATQKYRIFDHTKV